MQPGKWRNAQSQELHLRLDISECSIAIPVKKEKKKKKKKKKKRNNPPIQSFNNQDVQQPLHQANYPAPQS
jgi:hypothetical protein